MIKLPVNNTTDDTFGRFTIQVIMIAAKFQNIRIATLKHIQCWDLMRKNAFVERKCVVAAVMGEYIVYFDKLLLFESNKNKFNF